ncbi:hydroxyproline-rich glycoprotein family protein [Senna tora]|uniref:Hydroxyproline-rich glycoprotein family protein n=1 Tax=Senna tora TaxID=362788 RepID=A0A834X3L3_9FABA|nr:hydroxyproline-rich glycoprotein family protein [Senna tora]
MLVGIEPLRLLELRSMAVRAEQAPILKGMLPVRFACDMTSFLRERKEGSLGDLSFDIDPSMGLTYVKGKIDPHLVLKKLKKGGKHAKIHWLTYGRHTDRDQYSGPIQLQPYPQFPGTYTNYDHPYNNYHHLYGHYNNPLHNNNNPGHHLFPNNAPPLQPSRRLQQRRSSDHPHKRNSPEPSPFKPSTSSQGRVTEPVVKRHAAAFIGLDQFIKQVVSIKKLT